MKQPISAATGEERQRHFHPSDYLHLSLRGHFLTSRIFSPQLNLSNHYNFIGSCKRLDALSYATFQAGDIEDLTTYVLLNTRVLLVGATLMEANILFLHLVLGVM